jgi:hypothetical protein
VVLHDLRPGVVEYINQCRNDCEEFILKHPEYLPDFTDHEISPIKPIDGSSDRVIIRRLSFISILKLIDFSILNPFSIKGNIKRLWKTVELYENYLQIRKEMESYSEPLWDYNEEDDDEETPDNKSEDVEKGAKTIHVKEMAYYVRKHLPVLFRDIEDQLNRLVPDFLYIDTEVVPPLSSTIRIKKDVLANPVDVESGDTS